MSFSVAAWNVREGLAQPNQNRVVEHIKQLNSDVVILPDAYSLQQQAHSSSEERLVEATDSLQAAGYAWFEAEYADAIPWHHDRHIVMLSRIDTPGYTPLRLRTRNAYKLTVKDEETAVDVIGFHGDDRSEATRRGQTAAILETIDMDEPVVVGGDFNSVHSTDFVSGVIGARAMRLAANLIPLKRPRSLGKRVVEMMDGSSLKQLLDAGFTDADNTHYPTSGKLIPMFQLDHVLYTDAHLARTDFKPGKISRESDHLPIMAKFTV